MGGALNAHFEDSAALKGGQDRARPARHASLFRARARHAGLAAEPLQEHAFVTEFLTHWGESAEHRSARRQNWSRSRG